MYKTRECSSADGDYFYAGSFYCVEIGDKKVHVEGFSDWEDVSSVRLIGLCDGSCMHSVELSQAIEDLVMGRVTEVVAIVEEEQSVPRHWFLDKFQEEMVEESATDKVVRKINRWTERYRWTRNRRFVEDFSWT